MTQHRENSSQKRTF